MTWRGWASPIVDYGRELYAAWRLNQGDVLYRDIAWFNGPFSAWWNSFWFGLLGETGAALVSVNLLLIVLAAALIARLLARAFDRTAAAVGVPVFLIMFALAHPLAIGNYNFITPYSHELVHGVLLGLATLAIGDRWVRSKKLAWCAPLGLLLGAAFLTKPEIFIASAAAAGMLWIMGSSSLRQAAAAAGLAIACALVLPAAAWFRLHADLPAQEALQGVLGAWPHLMNEEVRALPFYSAMSGFAAPDIYLQAMLRAVGRYAVYFGAWYAFIRLITRANIPNPYGRKATQVAYAGLSMLAHALFLLNVPWTSLARPLPLLALLFGAVALLRGLPRRNADTPRLALRAGLATFAGAMLFKVLLNVHFYHYGFVLALPATLLAVGFSTCDLPAWLSRKSLRDARRLRTLAIGFWVVLASSYLLRSARNLRVQATTVGFDADRLQAIPELGEPLQQSLEWLRTNMDAEHTLLVMPEGVMLNYQLRRVNPTPYINFMPPELLLFGESAMLASLKSSAPDFIAIVHKDTSEYGFPYFGTHYGEQLYDWVRKNYQREAVFGALPLTSSNFGVAIYKR